MVVDFYTDAVEHLVRFLCSDTPPRHASGFGIPQGRIDCHFATELRGLAPVNGDTSHDGNSTVLSQVLSFQIEQHAECTSHNSHFLMVQNY